MRATTVSLPLVLSFHLGSSFYSHRKAQQRQHQLYHSAQESIEAIQFTSSLVSYQCNEDQLRDVLAARTDPLTITSLVRGKLEDFVDEDSSNNDCVVDRFLLALASCTTKERILDNGLATCRSFLFKHTVAAGPFQDFNPPTRTLIGTLDGMDISLLRDKQDVHRRFTLLLSDSMDRAKDRKVARILVEFVDGTVYIRGLCVNEHHRGKGLSTQLIAVMCDVCHKAFGFYPKTRLINKPLVCVALSSLGFTAGSNKWPALVAPHPTNPHITLLGKTTRDLAQQFPYAVRKAQQIELVSSLPSETKKKSRQIYILTTFAPPVLEMGDPVEQRLERSEYQLYSARIVAFVSTFEAGKELMFQRSRVLQEI